MLIALYLKVQVQVQVTLKVRAGNGSVCGSAENQLGKFNQSESVLKCAVIQERNFNLINCPSCYNRLNGADVEPRI